MDNKKKIILNFEKIWKVLDDLSLKGLLKISNNNLLGLYKLKNVILPREFKILMEESYIKQSIKVDNDINTFNLKDVLDHCKLIIISIYKNFGGFNINNFVEITLMLSETEELINKLIK